MDEIFLLNHKLDRVAFHSTNLLGSPKSFIIKLLIFSCTSSYNWDHFVSVTIVDSLLMYDLNSKISSWMSKFIPPHRFLNHIDVGRWIEQESIMVRQAYKESQVLWVEKQYCREQILEKIDSMKLNHRDLKNKTNNMIPTFPYGILNEFCINIDYFYWHVIGCCRIQRVPYFLVSAFGQWIKWRTGCGQYNIRWKEAYGLVIISTFYTQNELTHIIQIDLITFLPIENINYPGFLGRNLSIDWKEKIKLFLCRKQGNNYNE